MSVDDRLPVGMAERRVVDHDVFLGHALGLEVGLAGSCWWCADRRSRCRRAPSASPNRLPRSSGSRRRGWPAGSARRPCRRRCAGFPRPRTGRGRRAGCSAPRTPAAPTCATPRSSSRTRPRPCPDRDQLARLLGEQRPVGSRVDDDGLELLAEQAALLVLLVDQEQHRVLERRLARSPSCPTANAGRRP